MGGSGSGRHSAYSAGISGQSSSSTRKTWDRGRPRGGPRQSVARVSARCTSRESCRGGGGGGPASGAEASSLSQLTSPSSHHRTRQRWMSPTGAAAGTSSCSPPALSSTPPACTRSATSCGRPGASCTVLRSADSMDSRTRPATRRRAPDLMLSRGRGESRRRSTRCAVLSVVGVITAKCTLPPSARAPPLTQQRATSARSLARVRRQVKRAGDAAETSFPGRSLAPR
mmetsp:Transcript_20874/g.62207  ORF Transcript_20874/g.62207 Transcript_20874/m.62207 type:complete len:228 (+) Transcript_20874:43-726(+)